jgi:hypothetical protein
MLVRAIASVGSVVLGLLVPTTAHPQAVNPHNGSWTAKFPGPKGESVTADVVIKDNGGSWRTNTRNRGNNCIGIESPIDVKTASDEELVFRVVTSRALAGCNDFAVSVKGAGTGKLSGTMGDGRPVTLEK